MQEETDAVVEASTADLSLDVVFDALSSSRRRFMLRYIDDQPDRQCQLKELSEAAAEWEIDTGNTPSGAEDVQSQSTDGGHIPSEITKRYYVSIYQTHGPKLDDMDIIDHDTETGVLSPGEHFDDAVGSLDAAATSLDGPEGDRTRASVLGRAVGRAAGLLPWPV